MSINHRVIVDAMFIDGRPVFIPVDESTHLTATAFLRSQSASDIWKAILRLCILVYMGPPEFVKVE